MSDTKSCGTCKWFKPPIDTRAYFGDCEYEPLPDAVERALEYRATAIAKDGAECPTYMPLAVRKRKGMP